MTDAATKNAALEYEPFGQAGMRQYIGSIIVLISLSIATAAAILWHRSYNVLDVFQRTGPLSEIGFRSVYGRLVITKTDWYGNPIGAPQASAWTYEQFPILEGQRDGWRDSWQKTIGIEYHDTPIQRDPSVRDGWWFRLRWRTVAFLCAIPPIVHFFRYRRLLRRKQIS